MKKIYLKYAFVGICVIFSGLGILSYNNKKPLQNYKILEANHELVSQYPIEENYTAMMYDVVEPYLETIKQEGMLTTSDESQIYYRYYPSENSKATVVISHGFSEWLDKYNELIYYFNMNDYSVYIPSHRGHGLSTRLVDDLSMVHIEDFNDYAADLATLIDTEIKPNLGDTPLVLFAHSMGGGIATLLLQNYPELVDLAILSSPMLEVKLPGVPNVLGHLVANFYDFIGKGTDYVFTHGPFEGVPQFETSSTQSENRYMYYFDKRMSHDYYHTEGGSFSWLKEAISATNLMAINAHKIDIPILVFQAELDDLVKPGGQNRLVRKAENAELVFVPDAKHELYFEQDPILLPYLNTIFNFLDRHLED